MCGETEVRARYEGAPGAASPGQQQPAPEQPVDQAGQDGLARAERLRRPQHDDVGVILLTQPGFIVRKEPLEGMLWGREGSFAQAAISWPPE